MPQFPAILSYALAFTWKFKYPLVLVGSIIEGPILMIASGFLMRLGYFELIPLYLSIIVGDLIGDVGWYYAGAHIAEPFVAKHGKYFGVSPEQYHRAKEHFKKRPNKIMLVSKLTMGFGLAVATMMVAGAIRLPMRTFLFYNAIGEFGFAGMMLAIGFAFGHFYESIASAFKIGFLVVGAAVLGAAVLGFTRYIKRKEVELL